MNSYGLALCSRFAYPPNSYAFCGPSKQKDLKHYSARGDADRGLTEILSRFTTLYPYLCLIAGEHTIKDPFDPSVVEAYWIGNALLHTIPIRRFAHHLTDTLSLKKKTSAAEHDILLSKLPRGGLAHHAFHVINVWRRTGHVEAVHTLRTMEACLINWGRVIEVSSFSCIIEARPLIMADGKLFFSPILRKRTIAFSDDRDVFAQKLHAGQWISYHWGNFCTILTRGQLRRLIFYTQQALDAYNLCAR